MEVVHQENLAAARAEAVAVVNRLMDENNRLKLFLVAGAPPGCNGGGGGPSGPGNGGGGGADFSLAALGGFGARDGGGGGMPMSYSVSPQRRAPAHLSPLRGSSMSPLRGSGNPMLPGLQQAGQAQGLEAAYGGGAARGRVSSQRR
jgi:hypothetical protein